MTDPKQTIMVVDDDPDIIEQLTHILTREGYEVCAAESAADAQELLATVRPTLAIVDVMMEERDAGFVLCHKLKKLYPDAPVIILTAVKAATGICFAANTAEEHSWIQADRVLDKPVQSDRLKAEIHRLLGKAPAETKAH